MNSDKTCIVDSGDDPISEDKASEADHDLIRS
jgi:hypothetical protein